MALCLMLRAACGIVGTNILSSVHVAIRAKTKYSTEVSVNLLLYTMCQ
jgi:hypothetical protein